VVPLTQADTTGGAVQFYWVDGGDARQVQHSVDVEGISCSGKTTFDVKRPIATMTTSTDSVKIDDGLGYLALQFGDDVTPGIAFTCTISIPEGFSGSTEFVQIYHYDRARCDYIWGWEHKEGSGLDGAYPYGTGGYADDTPHQELIRAWSVLEVDDSAEIWYMFKPTGGIPVPLRKVAWWWKGTATNEGFPFFNDWELLSSGSSQNPGSQDTTDHPEWDQNADDIGWQ